MQGMESIRDSAPDRRRTSVRRSRSPPGVDRAPNRTGSSATAMRRPPDPEDPVPSAGGPMTRTEIHDACAGCRYRLWPPSFRTLSWSLPVGMSGRTMR